MYHVTIMPCYDKKLEASRPDFFDDVLQTKDVDCVITTGELDKLMLEEGFDVRVPAPGEDTEGGQQVTQQSSSLLPSLLERPGTSSGGYLFSLMEATWHEWLLTEQGQQLQQEQHTRPLPQVDVKIIRTADFTEYILRAPTPEAPILFKGAHCYGFRNLQNLVRKVQRQTGVKSRKGAAASSVNGESLSTASGRGRMRGGVRGRGGAGMMKRNRGGAEGVTAVASQESQDAESRGYDYVEVMACPGGCVNGGGQIRPPTSGDAKELPSSGISMAITSGLQEQTEAQIDTPTAAPLSAAKSILNGGASTSDLDPEGYPSSISLTTGTGTGTPSSLSGFSTPNTDEPDMTTGWQGTSKDWVKRVEDAYWCTTTSSSGGTGGLKGTSSSLVDKFRSSPASVYKASSDVDRLAEEIMSQVGSSEVFLRTSYRAVQDEAVNGLAVQW